VVCGWSSCSSAFCSCCPSFVSIGFRPSHSPIATLGAGLLLCFRTLSGLYWPTTCALSTCLDPPLIRHGRKPACDPSSVLFHKTLLKRLSLFPTTGQTFDSRVPLTPSCPSFHGRFPATDPFGGLICPHRNVSSTVSFFRRPSPPEKNSAA